MFNFALSRYEEWKTSDAGPKKQQPLMTQFTTSEKYGAMHQRQKELQKAVITNLIVRGNLPLNTVERPWFKTFMAVVDPKFNVPCRRKVASEINYLYDLKRNVLLNKLMSVESLSLTLESRHVVRQTHAIVYGSHGAFPDIGYEVRELSS